jgi:hypothetical protein
MRLLALALVSGIAVYAIDVNDLIHKSVIASERNWKAAPNYIYVETDIEEKLDSQGNVKSKTEKTYEVRVMEGSQYNKLLKVNGHALTPAEQQNEERKMLAERERRRREPPSERAKRIAKYQKERQQDHAMMGEMVHAFNFTLAGEETVNGRRCYVLNASPKPGYVPRTRDTKVLTGMKGKLWVDQQEAQWVKVEAEVIRPVSFYAVATVGPGTKFTLVQMAVGQGIWMPAHFSVRVNSTLFFFSRNSSDDETYTDYRLASGESARSN